MSSSNRRRESPSRGVVGSSSKLRMDRQPIVTRISGECQFRKRMRKKKNRTTKNVLTLNWTEQIFFSQISSSNRTDPSLTIGRRKEIDNVMKKARANTNDYWDKKLLEVEEKDPNRWRHTGYKKMYIEGESSSESDREFQLRIYRFTTSHNVVPANWRIYQPDSVRSNFIFLY